MAAVTFKKKMKDKFFECSICMDYFKDPKSLPCLHRFCEQCLDDVIATESRTVINCPLCKSECEVPKEGAAGWKTDFHTKSMLEFIQLQTTVNEGTEKMCISCSKKRKAAAYCFKCKNFLCSQCLASHQTSDMFTEHRPHLLNLSTVEAKNLTLLKLASLTEDPRCNDHPRYMAQLCCVTCRNQPVCLACVYGMHKDHDLHDVNAIAKFERAKMTEKLYEVNSHKDNLYGLKQKVETVEKTLTANVAKKTDKLISQHICQLQVIKKRIGENERQFEKTRSDIDRDEGADRCRIETEFDEKIKLINEERAKALRETGGKHGEMRRLNCGTHDENLADLNRRLGALDGDLKRFTEIINTQGKDNKYAIQEIGDYTNHTINRYENFTATTTTILASSDDWTDAQCLPDVRAASGLLIEDMKKTYPGLESLSDIAVRDLPPVFNVKVTVVEHAKRVVDVGALKGDGWAVWNMASTGDGRIVITGKASDEYSYIVVTNMNGEILRQDNIKKQVGSKWPPFRYCNSFSQYQVVTLCMTNQIGIYDVRNGSHIRKNISDLIRGWSSDRHVSCITTDPVTRNIYVGSMGSDTNTGIRGDVLVFDDKLNYRSTLVLPEGIRASRDITVHDGTLVVCDLRSKRAYDVTMEGPEGTVVREFDKPDHDGGDWCPIRVCKDSNNYIYMLWEAKISGEWRIVLTQYSQDGEKRLATIPVDGDAFAICTTMTDEGEKLMITTLNTGKMFILGLNIHT